MRRHLITATTLAIAATALLAGCSGNNLGAPTSTPRRGATC